MRAETDPRTLLNERLRELREEAGLSVRGLVIASARTPARRPGETAVALKRSTIADMTGLTRPVLPEPANFEVFVDTCLRVAAAKGRTLRPEFADRQVWDRLYREVGERLRGVQTATPAPSDAPCPYRGLDPFRPQDAADYFGRDDLVALLRDRYADQSGKAEPLLVTGASGAGKSSLLRAGLVPFLLRGRPPADGAPAHVLLDAGPSPVRTLLNALAPWTSEVEPAAVQTALAGRPGPPLAVIVDQFERVFAAPREERMRLLALLAALCGGDRPAAVVVLGLRADFFGHCSAHPELVPALAHPLVVPPMREDELRAAIEGPAGRAGLTLEPGLADLLLEDLGEAPGRTADAGVLPLLSHALKATWERRERGTLTLAGYRATGGVSRALARTADALVDGLDQTERGHARRLLTGLVRIGDGTPDTGRIVPRARLLPAPDAPEHSAASAVLDLLVTARLVTADEGAVRLAHESLPRWWTRLRGWLDADRAALLARQRLDARAREWDEYGRDPDGLLRGARLDEAKEAVSGHPSGAVTAEFLERSALSEAGRARAAERRKRLSMAAIATLAALVMLLAGAGAIAYRAADEAGARGREAVSLLLAGKADQTRATDPDLAGGLALTAWHYSHTDEARFSLASSAASPTRLTVDTGDGEVLAVAFGADGSVVTGGLDGVAQAWDPDSGRPLGEPLTDFSGGVLPVVFSADGSRFATGEGGENDTGAVRVWDAKTRSPVGGRLKPGSPDIAAVAFRADGSVAIGDAKGAVEVWDVATGRRVGEPSRVAAEPWAMAFSRDGRRLAVGEYAGPPPDGGGDTRPARIRIWDVDTRRALGSPFDLVQASKDRFQALAFSPDGATLAIGGDDGVITLWDATAHRVLGTLRGHVGAARALAFGPDGTALASGGADGTVRVWDVARRLQTGGVLRGNGSEVVTVAFAPDGGSIAGADLGGVLRVWAAPTVLGGTAHLAVSADGRVLAICDQEGDTTVFDASGDPLARPFRVATSGVTVALSPDGSVLAALDGDRITRWSAANGAALGAPLEIPADALSTGPAALAFADGGRSLALVSSGGKLVVWDTASGAPEGGPKTVHGERPLSSAEFSRDGDTLVTAEAGTVTRWRTSTGTPLGDPLVVTDTHDVFGASLSPDGSILAVSDASDDSAVTLWDTASARPLGSPLRLGKSAASDAVAGAFFSADSATLGIVQSSGHVRLWDVRARRELTDPLPLGPGPAAALFAPGPALVVATDRTWRWPLAPPGSPSSTACRALGPLTPAEWTAHLPDAEDYAPLCR
ncbi:WD40 repeat protein [Actinocorallia herbida]|uniref:WD40 repeat protein n=1 Tax=Actinocorallia herbida TaxID=58109 RepID=A0A3N1CZZ8_9ACTN|nr:hypothetical protein [Actinocorallia herbida]ROO86849.1 WD40 repeat protein [Actinocorallia herbida]